MELTPAQEIIQSFGQIPQKESWNLWRKHYDSLPISDVIWLNNAIDGWFPNQAHYSFPWLCEAFELIDEEDLEYPGQGFLISELGCHTGSLAHKFLGKYDNISEWHGFDINYAAIDRTKFPELFAESYLPVKMTEWPWEGDYFGGEDVFVSSHVLEHFNFLQICKIVDDLIENLVAYLLIELPFEKEPSDTKWHDFDGAHVLSCTEDEFAAMMEQKGYHKYYYKYIERKSTHIYGFSLK